MRTKTARVIVPMLTTLMLGLTARCVAPARACAAVAWKGARVSVVDESALIIWNASEHHMDFIRRATFNSTANQFGFLVPSPSQPKLSGVDDNLFVALEDLIKPKVVEERLTGFALGLAIGKIFAAGKSAYPVASSKGSSVHVLDTQHVAGFDATVIEASDAVELLRWLKDKGYESRPELQSWLEPYIKLHWIITAFKVSKDNPNSGRTASYAVRMSFKADHPYFPYREPEDARSQSSDQSSRTLRVFLVSSGRMQGSLGDPNNGRPWVGTLKYAKSLNAADSATLQGPNKLTANQFPASAWLNAFEDRSTPRLGTDDVFFSTSNNQSFVEAAPIVHTIDERVIVPLEGVAVAAIVAIWLISFVMSRRDKGKVSR